MNSPAFSSWYRVITGDTGVLVAGRLRFITAGAGPGDDVVQPAADNIPTTRTVRKKIHGTVS